MNNQKINIVKLIIILLLIPLFTYSNNIKEILSVIKQVESNGNIEAIGDNGKAFGILQIHKVCIDDVNRLYGTSYTHEDAFNETCSEEIFELYISAGINRYKNKYNKQPTEQDIVRMWNGGFYNGYKNKRTVKYFQYFLKWKNIMKKKENSEINKIISKKSKIYNDIIKEITNNYCWCGLKATKLKGKL